MKIPKMPLRKIELAASWLITSVVVACWIVDTDFNGVRVLSTVSQAVQAVATLLLVWVAIKVVRPLEKQNRQSRALAEKSVALAQKTEQRNAELREEMLKSMPVQQKTVEIMAKIVDQLYLQTTDKRTDP